MAAVISGLIPSDLCSYISIFDLPLIDPTEWPNSLPSRFPNQASSYKRVPHNKRFRRNKNASDRDFASCINFAWFSNPIVLSWLSPRASYRMVNAALAARDQEVFPLSFGAAWSINDAWEIRPYVAVACLVFRALKRAFSAPRIWTVLPGCLARFNKLPPWAIR